MERNKKYKFLKKFETMETTGKVNNFKNLTFEVVDKEGTYTSYCECKIEGYELNWLIGEKTLDDMLESGGIEELD